MRDTVNSTVLYQHTCTQVLVTITHSWALLRLATWMVLLVRVAFQVSTLPTTHTPRVWKHAVSSVKYAYGIIIVSQFYLLQIVDCVYSDSISKIVRQGLVLVFNAACTKSYYYGGCLILV